MMTIVGQAFQPDVVRLVRLEHRVAMVGLTYLREEKP